MFLPIFRSENVLSMLLDTQASFKITCNAIKMKMFVQSRTTLAVSGSVYCVRDGKKKELYKMNARY